MSREMLLERLKRWLTKHRGLILVTLLALLVRLNWNLKIHPPLDYPYSDMGGYLERASSFFGGPWKTPPPDMTMLERLHAIFDGPWKPQPYMTLFPYGTHVFLFLVKLLFGLKNKDAIGVSFALLGTLSVAFTYATAKRFSTHRWMPRITGLLLIVYYPWISLGGYTLSEAPFTLGVSASAYFGLCLADEGRPRDAWLCGLAYGLGATARPQLLISAAFFVLFYLLRRRSFHNFTRGLWARFAIPLGLVLAVSAVRIYWHTSVHWRGGMFGLVSTNGPLNFALGRCHSAAIESRSPDGRGYFAPPVFTALKAYGKEHPGALITQDPAMGDTVRFNGHMWDAGPIYDTAWKCVQASGYMRQARYTLTHVILLWGYNSIWPDQGQKLEFRRPMMLWCNAHLMFLLPPAALATLAAFRRRRARSMLVALHVWAVVVVAMLYFGDTRYRAPYDGIIIVLAIEGYVTALRWLALQVGGIGMTPRITKGKA